MVASQAPKKSHDIRLMISVSDVTGGPVDIVHPVSPSADGSGQQHVPAEVFPVASIESRTSESSKVKLARSAGVPL